MGKQIQIKFNSDGYAALMRSDAAQALLREKVEKIAAAAGGEPDFEADVQLVGGSSKLNRAMGYVRTATYEGRRAQAEDNVLIRALDAGRG